MHKSPDGIKITLLLQVSCLLLNSSPHPLPQKAMPGTSRLPTQMPLQANILTWLFSARPTLVPSLPKLSALLSGGKLHVKANVSSSPSGLVWAMDNLEVTAEMLPWKMWWKKTWRSLAVHLKMVWSLETLWWILFQDKSLWSCKSWLYLRTPRPVCPYAPGKWTSISTHIQFQFQVCNLPFLLLASLNCTCSTHSTKYSSIVTCDNVTMEPCIKKNFPWD